MDKQFQVDNEFTFKTMNIMRLVEHQIETSKYLVRELYDECPDTLAPQLFEIHESLLKIDSKISNFIQASRKI